jgi:hypothetical protein
MNFYQFFVDLYNQFLQLFPAPLQWLVTLIVFIGLVVALINLVRFNWVFLLVLVILLPFVAPVLQHFLLDLYNFFLYLLSVLHLTAPH